MIINNTPIYLGTAGYNYEDWKGTAFAPEDASNYDLLPYYVKTQLNFLELTYTFYKLPLAEKILGISDRIGDNVKLSVRVTKSLMRKFISDDDIQAFKEGIKPILDNGKLVSLIADFHPQFSASRENFSILANLKDVFSEVPVFFELTNSTWHKERFYDEFKAAGIGIVTIDAAKLKGIAPYYPVCSNNYLYFRLYGRSKLWIKPQERVLDYSYTDNELKKIIADINDKAVFAKKVFISFCNVTKANAPKNALRFMELI